MGWRFPSNVDSKWSRTLTTEGRLLQFLCSCLTHVRHTSRPYWNGAKHDSGATTQSMSLLDGYLHSSMSTQSSSRDIMQWFSIAVVLRWYRFYMHVLVYRSVKAMDQLEHTVSFRKVSQPLVSHIDRYRRSRMIFFGVVCIPIPLSHHPHNGTPKPVLLPTLPCLFPTLTYRQAYVCALGEVWQEDPLQELQREAIMHKPLHRDLNCWQIPLILQLVIVKIVHTLCWRHRSTRFNRLQWCWTTIHVERWTGRLAAAPRTNLVSWTCATKKGFVLLCAGWCLYPDDVNHEVHGSASSPDDKRPFNPMLDQHKFG